MDRRTYARTLMMCRLWDSAKCSTTPCLKQPYVGERGGYPLFLPVEEGSSNCSAGTSSEARFVSRRISWMWNGGTTTITGHRVYVLYWNYWLGLVCLRSVKGLQKDLYNGSNLQCRTYFNAAIFVPLATYKCHKHSQLSKETEPDRIKEEEADHANHWWATWHNIFWNGTIIVRLSRCMHKTWVIPCFLSLGESLVSSAFIWVTCLIDDGWW